jgi:glycosyltransferase involved in cell wall biosynthesis
MVTPHLPPYQAANALLPHQLGVALRDAGHEVRFLTLGEGPDTEEVRFVRRRRALRITRLPQLLEALGTWRKLRPLLQACDVVHVHSNTWVNQVAARLAASAGRPYVLTHYGTEIWHHDGRDGRFRRLNRQAGHVAFYSQALLERGRELGVPFRDASVVYPPVAEAFRLRQPGEREEIRDRLGLAGTHLLLNVKRLHPLADQATLLEAMALVRAQRADVRLWIAGTGEEELRLRERIGRLDLGASVRLLGLTPNADLADIQAAADLFVLSSRLEATPTVALEALACGTPVVSTDNPGGVELAGLFGDDVGVVPRSDPRALAQAILERIGNPRRACAETAALVESRFRLPAVTERYLELYRGAAA